MNVSVRRERRLASAAICVVAAGMSLFFAVSVPAQSLGDNSSQEPMVLPSVSLIAFPTLGYAPLHVGFRPSVDDPESSPIVAYDWHFGDGTESTAPPPARKIYRTPGTYVASVTVELMDGRSATGFVAITVQPPKGGR